MSEPSVDILTALKLVGHATDDEATRSVVAQAAKAIILYRKLAGKAWGLAGQAIQHNTKPSFQLATEIQDLIRKNRE